MNNEEEEKKSTFYTGVGLIKNKKTPKPSIPSINKRAISAIPKVRNNYNQKETENMKKFYSFLKMKNTIKK